MDAQGVERLSRQVAQAPSRRAVLGVLGAGLGAVLLGRQVAAADDVSDETFGLCRLPGNTCSVQEQCCSGKCQNGVCGCTKKGRYAIIGPICCSGKKKKGKCR